MLMALLYTEDGTLAGAAYACDAMGLGRRYWQEVYPEPIAEADTAELACVEIDDELLVARLLSMDFSYGREAAAAVDAYLFRRGTTHALGPLSDAAISSDDESPPSRMRPR